MAHKKMYEAVLISADGEEYVTDYKSSTKEEVIEQLENQGSRWIFYPYSFVVEVDPSKPVKEWKIKDAPDPFGKLKNKKVKDAMHFIEKYKDDLYDYFS